jgi:catechol 2,3-dioxygenase-like lactoylglutathione lyase family enzyme
MITGMHAVMFSAQADAVRAFFRDVLDLRSVDAGGGWLVFALPPAELGIHPAEQNAGHELYLMCDDIEATAEQLRGKGVQIGPVNDEGFGLMARLRLPDGSDLGLYEPRHASPLQAYAAERAARVAGPSHDA